MLLVPLTPAQVDTATAVGVDRQARAVALERQHRYGFEGDHAKAERAHVIGALGEYAVAKWKGPDVVASWLHRQRTATGLDHCGDIGDGQQVRATEWDTGHLIVHPGDDPAHRFMLARRQGRDGLWELAGWLYGREAQRAEWWRRDVRHPAYFAPAAALRRPKLPPPPQLQLF